MQREAHGSSVFCACAWCMCSEWHVALNKSVFGTCIQAFLRFLSLHSNSDGSCPVPCCSFYIGHESPFAHFLSTHANLDTSLDSLIRVSAASFGLRSLHRPEKFEVATFSFLYAFQTLRLCLVHVLTHQTLCLSMPNVFTVVLNLYTINSLPSPFYFFAMYITVILYIKPGQ